MGHEEYYIIKKLDSVQMKLATCIPPTTTTTIVLATVAVMIAATSNLKNNGANIDDNIAIILLFI